MREKEMADYTSENIHIGEGNLDIKAAGDNDFVRVGGCRDGSLDIKSKELNINIGQSLEPVDSYIIGREIMFSIILVETQLRNFAIAIGQDPTDVDETDPDFSSLKLYGNEVGSVSYLEMKYIIPRVQDKTKFIRFIATRCKVAGTFKLDFKKDNEWVYKLDVKMFPDPTVDPPWLTLEIQEDKIV